MSMGHAWQFECVLPNDTKLKSWFYSDSRQDATRRITDYLGAKLISLQEIDDPLQIHNKQLESDKMKAALDKKKQESFVKKYYE